MPTYDYVCTACGHEFEALQMMSAPHLKDCPKCTQESLKRKLGTGGGFLFKGSGFYETDYRSESYKSSKSSEAPKVEKSEPSANSVK